MNTADFLLSYAARYPLLQPQDAYKLLFQSAFGCEHLLKDEAGAAGFIAREAAAMTETALPLTEPLDGDFARVSLAWISRGLKPETLARLFVLSAAPQENGLMLFMDKLATLMDLTRKGALPFTSAQLNGVVDPLTWANFPPCHHSDAFREAYRPAYRVLRRDYAAFLPLFAQIDRAEKPVTFALEGGSASGKTTFAELFAKVYDGNVFHMDDFFLQPHQRKPERYATPGENVDWERFRETVLLPLFRGEAVAYQRFDCHSLTLLEPVMMRPKAVNLVEGVYSLHPALRGFYDFSAFLDIAPEAQRKRVECRNDAATAARYFSTWIPLENRYFEEMKIRERADLVIPVDE